MDHVAKVIRFSTNGFPPGKPPWAVRAVVKLAIGLTGQALLRRKINPGIKFPAAIDYLAPEKGLEWEVAVDRLTRAVEQAKAKGMEEPSPLAGHLGTQKWELLHCRHAELHFGFIVPDDQTTPETTDASQPRDA